MFDDNTTARFRQFVEQYDRIVVFTEGEDLNVPQGSALALAYQIKGQGVRKVIDAHLRFVDDANGLHKQLTQGGQALTLLSPVFRSVQNSIDDLRMNAPVGDLSQHFTSANATEARRTAELLPLLPATDPGVRIERLAQRLRDLRVDVAGSPLEDEALQAFVIELLDELIAAVATHDTDGIKSSYAKLVLAERELSYHSESNSERATRLKHAGWFALTALNVLGGLSSVGGLYVSITSRESNSIDQVICDLDETPQISSGDRPGELGPGDLQ